ncbi:MAG: hypothetical protein ACJ72T_02995 [Nitrososphaeraceae archaeon]
MAQIKQLSSTTTSANAEYAYVIQDEDVWFIDYIIGIAFKTPVDFSKYKKDTTSNAIVGLLESGRPYTEFQDIKDFQDYMEDKIGQEIAIESSVDPITNVERDDRRIVWYVTDN